MSVVQLHSSREILYKFQPVIIHFIIIIIIIIWTPPCRLTLSAERVRTLYQSNQRPQPHTTNIWKEEEDQIVGDTKERADHANRKALALLLKPASPTSSNTGSLRSFQRHREGHKGSAILRSPTTTRRERVTMSNQTTTSNTRRHIWQRQCTAQRMQWVTLNLE